MKNKIFTFSNIVLLITMLLIYWSYQAKAKIVVYEIDTGVAKGSSTEIDKHLPKQMDDFFNYIDLNSHGTHVAGIILKDVCQEVELQSCSYFDLITSNFTEYIECLKIAVNLKPNVVNISSGGPDFDQQEFDLIKKLSDMGTKIVVATGNDGKDLNNFDYYPAKYAIINLIPVGNLNKDGTRNITSNFGLPNEVWEIGTNISSNLPNGNYGYKTGTSQSTAKKTNKILLEMCKKTN